MGAQKWLWMRLAALDGFGRDNSAKAGVQAPVCQDMPDFGSPCSRSNRQGISLRCSPNGRGRIFEQYGFAFNHPEIVDAFTADQLPQCLIVKAAAVPGEQALKAIPII